MTRTYKYRIYPSEEQEQIMLRTVGCARKIYNLCLAWWQDAYKTFRETGIPMGKMPDYSFYKRQEQYAYMKEVDSVALQHARMDFAGALKNFFESKKGGRK